MNKIMIIAVAISVGIWSQYASAGEYADIGTPMTAEQLSANKCTEGNIVGGCKNPLYWSLYDEYTTEDCKEWMTTFSCTECKKGYVLTPYTCIPNNEQGKFYKDCLPASMTDEQLADAKFAYTCTCSDGFFETGTAGYLFHKDCDTGSIEYKCDNANKYYQSSSSRNPSCTVSTDSNGDLIFSRCSGCRLCNETAEYWKSSGTGYQRAYYNRFTDGSPATCTAYNIDKWRCAAGYYGSSTNGTSGCNPCPSLENAGLTPVCNDSGSCPYVKSPVGATQITQCYAGTWEPDLLVYLRDSSGTFQWIPQDDTINSYGECNYQ